MSIVPRFADLESIIRKAMALNPADRYSSARELAEDIRSFLRGKKVSAYVESADQVRGTLYKVAVWTRENLGLSVLLGSGGLAAPFLGAGLWMSAAARERAHRGLDQVPEQMRSSNPVDWTSAQRALLEANVDLASFRFDPTTASAMRANERELKELEGRLRVHEEFLQPACVAIAGTTSDFLTYGGRDRSSESLHQRLEQVWPNYRLPGTVADFTSWLEQRQLPDYDRKFAIEVTRTLLWNKAFKCPYHPHFGFREKQDAEQVSNLLQNARALSELLGTSDTPTMTELFLERRVAVSYGSNERVAEVDQRLTKMRPTTAMDHYLYGKHVQVHVRDFSQAVKIYDAGISVEEQRQKDLRASGRVAEASLAGTAVFGLEYAKATALTELREYSEARASLSRCVELAMGFSNSELSSIATAASLCRVGRLLAMEHAGKKPGDSRSRYVSQMRDCFNRASQLDPSNLPNLLNYAMAEFVMGDKDEAIRLYDRVLKQDPSSFDVRTRRAVSLAGLERSAESLGDIRCACRILAGLTPLVESPSSASEVIDEIAHLIETNRGAIDRMELQSVHNLATSAAWIARSTSFTDDERARLRHVSFEVLRQEISRVAKDKGYGRDVIDPSRGGFEELRTHDGELFRECVEAFQKLPPAPPYVTYQ